MCLLVCLRVLVRSFGFCLSVCLFACLFLLVVHGLLCLFSACHCFGLFLFFVRYCLLVCCCALFLFACLFD